MFSFIKKWFATKRVEKHESIYAPLSGTVISVEEIPDLIFASKLLGDGLAIVPDTDTVLSPVKGVVYKVYEAKHAFVIKTEGNLNVFIHFGINTASLNGEFIEQNVLLGDQVEVGTPLMRVNLKALPSRQVETLTPVIVGLTDNMTITNLLPPGSKVVAGKTVLYEVHYKSE